MDAHDLGSPSVRPFKLTEFGLVRDREVRDFVNVAAHPDGSKFLTITRPVFGGATIELNAREARHIALLLCPDLAPKVAEVLP